MYYTYLKLSKKSKALYIDIECQHAQMVKMKILKRTIPV